MAHAKDAETIACHKSVGEDCGTLCLLCTTLLVNEGAE